MTVYINLFGGPGVGKSTLALGLVYEMKRKGLSVEYVGEVAKDLVWEKREATLEIQPYVDAKQYRNLYRLKDKVDFVVTDAPLLKGLVYTKLYNPELYESYEPYIRHLNSGFKNKNFIIERSIPYVTEGRLQDEKTAQDIDLMIKDLLSEDNPLHFRPTYSPKALLYTVLYGGIH